MPRKQSQNSESGHKPRIYITPKGAFQVKAEELFASPKVRATLQEMAEIGNELGIFQAPLKNNSEHPTK